MNHSWGYQGYPDLATWRECGKCGAQGRRLKTGPGKFSAWQMRPGPLEQWAPRLPCPVPSHAALTRTEVLAGRLVEEGIAPRGAVVWIVRAVYGWKEVRGDSGVAWRASWDGGAVVSRATITACAQARRLRARVTSLGTEVIPSGGTR